MESTWRSVDEPTVGFDPQARREFHDVVHRLASVNPFLRHAAGLELPSTRRSGAGAGVMMIPIPKGGMLREVTGVEAARAVQAARFAGSTST